MDAGLIASWDELDLAVKWDGSSTVTGADANASFSATITSCQTTHFELYSVSPGIKLSISGTDTVASGSLSARLEIPLLSIDESWSAAAFATTLHAAVELDDVKLYLYGDTLEGLEFWILQGSAWRFVVDSAVEASGGAWSVDSSAWSPTLSPLTIPLLGVPPLLEALGYAEGGDMTVTEFDVDGEAEISGAVTGGWRFYKDSAWQALPVTLTLDAIPATASPDNGAPAVDVGAMSCTNTFDPSIAVYGWGEKLVYGPPGGVYGADVTYKRYGGSIMLVPDLDCSVERGYSSGYRALIVRGGLPKTESTVGHNTALIAISPIGGKEPVDGTRATRHASYSEFLASVGDAAHTIEDPLARTLSAPYDRWADSHEALYGSSEFKARYKYSGFPYAVEDRTANPQMLRVLNQADCGDATYGTIDKIARYVSYWGSPHWSYLYWFPTDVEDGALREWEWPVDGARANPTDYWLKVGHQSLRHPDLPVNERTRRRCTLVSAPLLEGGLSGQIRENYLGQRSSWWGICRFDAQHVQADASMPFDADSYSFWMLQDCTASFGVSQVELTPTGGATTIMALLNLGSWFFYPYMSVHCWQRMVLDWSATNVSSCKVYLEGVDGVDYLLCDDAPGTYDWPVGVQDIEYAGSWGQEFGTLTVSDSGTDLIGTGISATTYADARNSFAAQLLRGRTALGIKFVIEVVSSASPVNIDYPELRSDLATPLRSDTKVVMQETRQTAAILRRNGPGIRWGQWSAWDYSLATFNNPPAWLPLNSQCTVLDALVWKRLAIQANSSEIGLDTELTGLYDIREIGWLSLLPFIPKEPRQAAAYFTTSFITTYADDIPSTMGCTIVLSNSYRAVPPLCTFPEKARGADLQPGSSYAQESWSWAFEPRRIANPDSALHLVDTGGMTRTTVESGWPAGWAVTKHSPALDDDESDWHIRGGTTDFAHVRPWHGWFAVVEPTTQGGLHLSTYKRFGLMYAVASLNDGGIRIWRFNLAGDSAFFDVTTGGEGSAQVACPPDGSVLVAYYDGVGVKTKSSWDLGETWGVAVAVASGTFPALAVDPRTGLEFCALHNGTKWILYSHEPTAATWVRAPTPEGEICSLAAGPAGLEVSPDALNTLVFLVSDGTNVRRYVSTDLGDNWTEE